MDRRHFLLGALTVAVSPAIAGARRRDNDTLSNDGRGRDRNTSTSDRKRRNRRSKSTDTGATTTTSTPVATTVLGEDCSLSFVNGLVQFSSNCTGLAIPGLGITVAPPLQFLSFTRARRTPLDALRSRRAARRRQRRREQDRSGRRRRRNRR